jgi:hypothetical protein
MRVCAPMLLGQTMRQERGKRSGPLTLRTHGYLMSLQLRLLLLLVLRLLLLLLLLPPLLVLLLLLQL